MFELFIIECQRESKSAACNTFLWTQYRQALVLRVFFLYYALLNKEPCQLTHRRRQAVLQVSSLELCSGNTYTCRRSLFRTLRISLGLSCLVVVSVVSRVCCWYKYIYIFISIFILIKCCGNNIKYKILFYCTHLLPVPALPL